MDVFFRCFALLFTGHSDMPMAIALAVIWMSRIAMYQVETRAHWDERDAEERELRHEQQREYRERELRLQIQRQQRPER
ncbi:hypothetical protein [Streptosporangium sp. NPDC003464]